jgi:hypothetical protein
MLPRNIFTMSKKSVKAKENISQKREKVCDDISKKCEKT